jgi:ribonucrease Y
MAGSIPALIEEMADKVTSELDDLILKAGEEAVDSLRLARVPLELLKLLGRLKFRTSYSQNVLRHSVEAARLAGLMAPEIGLDPEIAKRAALVHDIGKAVDHEVEGRHADIGADLLRKAGESETS